MAQTQRISGTKNIRHKEYEAFIPWSAVLLLSPLFLSPLLLSPLLLSPLLLSPLCPSCVLFGCYSVFCQDSLLWHTHHPRKTHLLWHTQHPRKTHLLSRHFCQESLLRLLLCVFFGLKCHMCVLSCATSGVMCLASCVFLLLLASCMFCFTCLVCVWCDVCVVMCVVSCVFVASTVQPVKGSSSAFISDAISEAFIYNGMCELRQCLNERLIFRMHIQCNVYCLGYECLRYPMSCPRHSCPVKGSSSAFISNVMSEAFISKAMSQWFSS